MNIKVVVLSLIALLLALISAACGAAGSATTSVSKTADKEIVLVAADSGFNPDIVNLLKEGVAKQGFTLNWKVVNDIVLPNKLVNDGEADANMFQHEEYMKQFNKDNHLNVVPAFYTTFIPGILYSKKYKSLKDLPDNARIGIPADPANNGRALFMLRDQGVLNVKPGVPVTLASQRDITDNPHHFQFLEVDQLMLVRTLEDVDVGFVFGATAVQNGLSIKDALAVEDAQTTPYKGIIGTRPDLVGSPKMQAFQKAYQSDQIKQFLQAKYGDAVDFLW